MKYIHKTDQLHQSMVSAILTASSTWQHDVLFNMSLIIGSHVCFMICSLGNGPGNGLMVVFLLAFLRVVSVWVG